MLRSAELADRPGRATAARCAPDVSSLFACNGESLTPKFQIFIIYSSITFIESLLHSSASPAACRICVKCRVESIGGKRDNQRGELHETHPQRPSPKSAQAHESDP